MTNDEDEDLTRMDDQKHLWLADENEEKTEEFLSTKQIPITIVVEAGRLHMPLDQVTKLKPGNVLDWLSPLSPTSTSPSAANGSPKGNWCNWEMRSASKSSN